ncbi:hypothetical protein RN001_012092 [Aquatica leii]|uniref:C2H2-type domain-containing protein n=1 Tax=Aquatica leii TaxID=1421715 RepID=A0AAN7SPC3_9COLE|nr:hypothetical protein RN001_012092 [Aquatica leii]
MELKLQGTKNTKAICIPNGRFYESIYINLHQNTEEQTQDCEINGTSESVYDTVKKDNKNVILNSSTEDENTAVEALRQLGNISIRTKTREDMSLLTCLNCNIQLQVEDLETHAFNCEHYHVKCYNCYLTFYYQKYKEHSPCFDGFSTKCKICSVSFDRSSSLSTHMKIHYSPETEVLNPSTRSDDDSLIDNCDKHTFPILNNIWDDYEIIDENFTDVAQEMTIHTSKSNEFFDSNINIESDNSHIVLSKDDQNTNTCKKCNKSFKREKAFLSHLKLHSEVPDIICINCEESFVDDECLARHMEQCKNVSTWNASKSTFQKYVCSYCEKAFSTKQKLHRHLWIHRRKAFTCETCAACFEKQSELDMHRLATHQSTTGYFCNECGKCFSSRQGLWEHNRIHGPANHPYKCEECSKAFSSRQGYLIHKRAHNDERPYGCRFCWKAFRDGGTLRKHERIHTGVRPHICPLCAKAFNQKVVLREHVRWIHVSNWKPNKSDVFQCSLCEVTVTEKDDLCAHIVKHSDNMAAMARNKIGSEETATSVKNKLSTNVKIELGATVMHKCDLCDEQFSSRKELTKHVQMHI